MNADEVIEVLYRQHKKGLITKEEFEKRTKTVDIMERFMDTILDRKPGSNRIKTRGTKR